MEIAVNGENREVPESTTAEGLIELLDLRGRRLAIEVNGEIVPRGQHRTHSLEPGDRVEIVHAVGGG